MPNQRSTSFGSLCSTSSNGSSSSKKRPPVFPKRLYDMLEDAERDGYAHIISWMPDGKSFKIHTESRKYGDENPMVEVLKRTFNLTRYKSFLRQLQLYGFERTCKGPRRGICKHEFFVRGRRDLLFKKSIEDFQQKARENSRSPKTAQKIFQSASVRPEDVTSSAFSLPLCNPYPKKNGSGCQYLINSIIPTQLMNLVLPQNFNKAFELIDDDDVLSIESGEDVPCWSGMELAILRSSL